MAKENKHGGSSNDAKSTYFELPHPAAMIIVSLGLGLTALCYYRPDAVPYYYLGPLGTLARYLAYDQPLIMRLIWYFAVTCHVGEAIYSTSVSSAKAMEDVTKVKWFFSTLCFGVFSLSKLTAFNPSRS